MRFGRFLKAGILLACVIGSGTTMWGQEPTFGLVIDVTGETFLVNVDQDPVWINGYTIADSQEPGRLNWEMWTSIHETTETDPERVEGTLGSEALEFQVINPGPSNLTEISAEQGGYWPPGQAWSIGQPFGPGPFDGKKIVETLDRFTVSFSSPGPPIEYRLMRFVLQGDADRDGLVGLSDFSVLKTHFGDADATFEEGDFDLDSEVDLADFGLIKSSFGLNANRVLAPIDDGAIEIPEPAGILLGACALLALLWFARRQQHS